MTVDQQRRTLIRHGFVFLLIAILLGLATATMPHPQKWLAAHLTALLTGPLLAIFGLVWRDLRLTTKQRSVTFAVTFLSAYSGLVGNLYAAIVNLPGPASNPGVVGPPMEGMIFTALLAVIIPATAVSWGLMLFGMRGTPPS